MLRNICYTLMAGCVISSVWKMQSHSRLLVPGIEPDAGLEMSETSDTEQMDDLLTWVGMIEKASGLHSDDQAELFRPRQQIIHLLGIMIVEAEPNRHL